METLFTILHNLQTLVVSHIVISSLILSFLIFKNIIIHYNMMTFIIGLFIYTIFGAHTIYAVILLIPYLYVLYIAFGLNVIVLFMSDEKFDAMEAKIKAENPGKEYSDEGIRWRIEREIYRRKHPKMNRKPFDIPLTDRHGRDLSKYAAGNISNKYTKELEAKSKESNNEFDEFAL